MSLTRRQLLARVGAAAVAWQLRPWPVAGPAVPVAVADTPPVEDAVLVATLEAFADTLIPGEKRSPDDRAVAGAGAGPGAVQAGAVDLMRFPPAGISATLPAFVTGLDAAAATFDPAAVAADPTVPPLVALSFESRTALLVDLLDAGRPDRQAWEALAAIAFLGFHTAGHLHTADAVRAGHPGLAWIGFPQPDDDGLWRFDAPTYGRPLASEHPATVGKGHPA